MPDSTKRILTDETGQDIVSALQSLQSVIDPNGTAVAAAAKIDNMTVAASSLATGATPTATISEVSNHKHITFGIPTGNTGATPQLSIGTVTTLQPSQDATATLTGTDEAPVLNLGIPKGPSGNESIDDTAGLGDTDLVYSADKVVKLFRSEHEDLTSGNAEQVIGKVASTEKGAYLYRRGMHLGNRCREKVVGGTVAWNQLANIAGSSRTKTENNVTYTDNRDGSYTVSTTEQGASSAVTISITPTVKIQGHKVLFYGMPESSVEGLQFMCGWVGTRIGKSGIYSVTSASEAFSIVVENGTVISTAVKVVPQFFDLTQMFGSTVADALYAMEQATAGSGVAWFRSLFPKEYYAYDAGSLQSVQAASKVTTGFNKWDEQWEQGYYDSTGNPASGSSQIRCKNYISCFPSSNYYYRVGSGADGRICYFDANKTFISQETGINKVFTTPANCHFIKLSTASSYGGTYRYDICINISDPTKNGTYEPYSGHTHPFDTSLVLRGIPKLDSNNRLYYDGDQYESSGKVTRKYGIVDLGSLTWNRYSDTTSGNQYYFNASVNGMKAALAKIFLDNYESLNTGRQVLAQNNKFACHSNNYANEISIRDDSYTDETTFTTAMSGHYLLYELATPTTEQASPFTPIMSFDPAGTEEFTEWGTRDIAVPVGHETEYLTDPAKILNNIPLIEVEKESASVVTFSDGAEGLPLKELTVKVEPVQDLHGYDNPWPAGGGVNLLSSENISQFSQTSYGVTYAVQEDGSIKATGTVNTQTWNYTSFYTTLDTFGLNIGDTISLSCFGDDVDFAFHFYNENTMISGISARNTSTATVPENTTRIRMLAYCKASGAPTVGEVINKTFYPQFEKASTPSSVWHPYSNICPISGWTGANVTRTGRNLLPEKFYTGFGYNDTVGQVRTLVADESVTKNGNVFSKTVSSWGGTGMVSEKLKPGTYKCNITVSADTAGNTRSSIYVFDENFKTIRRINNLQTSGTWTDTITISEGEAYIAVNVSSTSTGTVTITSPQIELGSTATDYVPYDGETYQITFPSSAGTVYGGTLTVNKDGSGELVVDMAEVDLGTLTFGKQNTASSYRWRLQNFANAKPPSSDATLANIICEQYKTVTSGETWGMTSGTGIAIGANKDIYIYDTAYADAITLSGVQLVYELATPVTYQLTPVEVTTLLGINNLWSDTGDCGCIYRVDLKKYIDQRFAELSAAITALGT